MEKLSSNKPSLCRQLRHVHVPGRNTIWAFRKTLGTLGRWHALLLTISSQKAIVTHLHVLWTNLVLA